MPAPLAERGSLIGGGLASSVGGFLTVYPSGQTDPLASLDPDDDPQDFDLGTWSLLEVFEESPLEISGLLGATDSRRTGYRYFWEVDVLYDLRNPPGMLFRDIQPFQIVLWFGDLDFSGLFNQIGSPLDGDEVIDDRYYWSPLNKLDSHRAILDAKSKKQIGSHLIGHATGHVFLIPDQGDPTDQDTIPGAYLKYLSPTT